MCLQRCRNGGAIYVILVYLAVYYLVLQLPWLLLARGHLTLVGNSQSIFWLVCEPHLVYGLSAVIQAALANWCYRRDQTAAWVVLGINIVYSTISVMFIDASAMRTRGKRRLLHSISYLLHEAPGMGKWHDPTTTRQVC